jgi:hypothetical protein
MTGATPLGRGGAGAVYIVFPQAAGTSIDLALPPAGAVERLAGSVVRGHAGRTLALLPGGGVLVGRATERPEATDAAWLVASTGPPPRPAPPPAAAGPGGCSPARNVEVIVDDSSGMAKSDPDALRRLAIELLVSKPSNAGRVVGAIEFGTRAQEIFPPVTLSADDRLQRTLSDLLLEHVRHDAGVTDLNAPFAAAAGQNPDAQARIFLTDGDTSHTGEFDVATTAAGPPTYVVLVNKVRDVSRNALFRTIAEQTGGEFFGTVRDVELQGVIDTIDSVALGCADGLATAAVARTSAAGDAPPLPPAAAAPTIEQGVAGALPEAVSVTNSRPVAKFVTDLPATLGSADVTATWDSTSDRFAIASLTLVDGNRRIRVTPRALRRALAGRRVSARGLTLVGTRGETYLTLHVTGLASTASTRRASAATRRHFLSWATRRTRGSGRVNIRGAGYRRRR